MKYRKLGPSDISASSIALGTWAIGGWMWGGTDKRESIAAIHAALDNGINLIDTAPVYGFGVSEEIVGEALAGRRDKVVLATKCGLVWNEKKGVFFFPSNADGITENADREVYRYLGPASIRREVEDSLRRLKTDYIDLLQTHWQDSTTPIAESMETLLKLKEEGKVRAIGVCNASMEQVEEYRRCGQLDSDQEKFSMIDRTQEKDGKLAYTQKNKLAVLAYSPLALGLLSGRILPERKYGQGDQRNSKERFSTDNIRLVNKMLDEFKPLAAEKNISIAQLVIAWTISQPGITHALVGARKEKQAIENAQAGEVDLSALELEGMNETISRYYGKII